MSNAKSLMLHRGRPETVEINVNGEVVKVDIRAPNVAQKGLLPEQGGGIHADGRPKDLKRFIATTLAACCFEHGTTERLFSADDGDALVEAGPHIDALFAECMKRIHPDPDALKGKSEATPS